MKNRMKRAVAFLITIMLAVNILPASAPADVGEHGPFRLSKAGTWITLRLGKKDVMSYEEILGDLYTSTLDIRAYNIDNNYQDVSGANVQADWSSKKVRNLFTMPFDRPLKWSVYDTADGTWPYELLVYRDAYYTVTNTGTKTLTEVLRSAGVTQTTYDNYYMIAESETTGIISTNVLNHTFTFQTTDIPEQGIQFRLTPQGGQAAPFKLIFVGNNDPDNANDGIFSYSLNQTAGTATVTGFYQNLPYSEEYRENITIPATITWPKHNGTVYQVTAITDNAFIRDAYIHTITIESPVMSIGAHAFEQVEVTDVLVTGDGDNSNLSIGEQAFFACTYLENFRSDAGISYIGPRAFAYDNSLQTLTGGNSRKTYIEYTNAFQYATGELVFNGGIEYINSYTFYASQVSQITTTGIDGMWSANTGNIDLILNISQPIGTMNAAATDELLNCADQFNEVTLNLNAGVDVITAGSFDNVDQYNSLTVNIADNGATTIVEEGAIPDVDNLIIHFDMYRKDVKGSNLLIPLETAGKVTYKDSEAVSSLFHDDVFWYELINNKAYVIDLYNTSLDEITFTNENQGAVHKADESATVRTLSVAGVKSGAFKENDTITSVVFNNTKTFTVQEDAFTGMRALTTVAVNNQYTMLPSKAFSDCTALETAIFGTADNQYGNTYTIPAEAFKGCGSLKTLLVRFNAVNVKADAFEGCDALKVVSFAGQGQLVVPQGTFKDATGIEVLRIDNATNVESGAFAVSNGSAFVMNSDNWINENLLSKIGFFEDYFFTANSPWYFSDKAFSGQTAKLIYIYTAGSKVPRTLINAVKAAGSNLTDIYLDCRREDVSFAEELDEANPRIRIHYQENNIPVGCYLDGVNGNDANDGSEAHPFKTFGKAKDELEKRPDSDYGKPVAAPLDTDLTDLVNDACNLVGVAITPSIFKDYYIAEKQVIILNTVTVSSEETWSSGSRTPITLIRGNNFKGVLVNVTGSLSLDHVILDGNSKLVTAEKSIINVKRGATLNLGDGAVLRNNAYPQAGWDGNNFLNGGAIYAESATVNIRNGSLIENNLAMSGGGIMMNGGTLNMSGGTIRNNTIRATTYQNNVKVNGTGGGIILIMGATMNLSGGTITGNKAEGQTASGIGVNGSTGGGIHVGSGYANVSTFKQGSTLNMTGGTVSDNTAHAQGGGIYIQASCVATITGGHITGNQSGEGEFGGGGIYVNAARDYGTVNGLLKMNNVLITDNDAPYGGGIACCETVNLSVYMGNGSAIYGNKDTWRGRNSDLFFFRRHNGFSSSGTKAKIALQMMNGADYNWTYVVLSDYEPNDSSIRTGDPVPEDILAKIDAGSLGHVVMRSNPTNRNVNAKVVISGNKAKTKGGGIGSNGDVIIGDVPPTNPAAITPEVQKKVVGRDMKEGETFTFSVYLEESSNFYKSNTVTYSYTEQLVGTGTYTAGKNGETGRIDLPTYTTGNLGSDNLGDTYTLLVLEDTLSTKELKADEKTYFALTYTIGQGKDSSGKACYTAYLKKAEQGEYTRDETGKIEFNYGPVTYSGNAFTFYQRIRKEISAADAVFVNTYTPPPVVKETSVKVSKQWDDMENLDGSRPDSITMTLLADGKEKQTVILNEGNGWTAEVTGLPVTNAQGKTIAYTWKEEDIAGYTGKAEIAGNETVFTNTHKPELTSVSVRKIWDDNDNEEKIRPIQIVMKLSNGMIAVLNAKNNWTATISDLPVTYKGQKIEYTWTEVEVIGYDKPKIEQNGNITVFTNTIWKRPDEPEHGKKPKVPGKPTEIFEEYDTPLGVEVMINHVGDCFD